MKKLKLVRVTTVPLSFKGILVGQMNYLKNQGIDVIMVSSSGKEIKEIVNNEKCPHVIIPMTRKISPLQDLISIWRMFVFFRQERPDIIHAQSLKAILISMVAGSMAGVNIRIQTMAGLLSTKDNSIRTKILESVEWFTYQLSTHVWPNSLSSYNHILTRKLCNKEKMNVIGKGSSNGIDLTRFDRESLNSEKLLEIKDLIGFNEDYFYFLFVGRVVKDKGIIELIDAFKEVSLNYNHVRLLIVGPDEPDLDPISVSHTKELENNEKIYSVGWSDYVEYYMELSNCFVFPSHREGFPNVLLQAGAIGSPIICSNIIGNIDIVNNDKNGLLFTKADVKDLIDKMNYAVENCEEMKEMAINLNRKIKKHYDRRIFHQYLFSEYQKILQK